MKIETVWVKNKEGVEALVNLPELEEWQAKGFSRMKKPTSDEKPEKSESESPGEPLAGIPSKPSEEKPKPKRAKAKK